MEKTIEKPKTYFVRCPACGQKVKTISNRRAGPYIPARKMPAAPPRAVK